MGERYLSEPFLSQNLSSSLQCNSMARTSGRSDGGGGGGSRGGKREREGKSKSRSRKKELSWKYPQVKFKLLFFWQVSPCSPNIYSQAEQDESILYLSIEEVFIPSAFSSLKYLKSHPDGEGQ